MKTMNKNQRLIGILCLASGLLLLPAVGMLFSSGVNWTSSDFIIAAVLLFGTGLLCEFVLRFVRGRGYRLLLCAIILAALALVWIELAVGIFGSPFAGS